MSDRFEAPTESWRPQRRDRSLDPQVIRMAMMAGGAVAVLALGYGGYAVLTRAPRTVPVIEADSRPVRVKPDNPGGMQVAGAEEQIMGGSGTGQADAMAPAPEVPQPQMLRAQIQAARQPPQPAPAPVPPPAQTVSLSPPVLAPPAAPAPVAAPLPAEPRPAAQPKPAVRALAPSTPATAGGGTEVQLAAMDSEPAAMAEWARLSKRMPDLLASHRPAVQKAERDGKPLYRLRTGGFSDVAQATTFCTQVRAKGGGCSIANF